MERKRVVYVEPEGYIPKDILKKYFPEVIEEEKDSWEDPIWGVPGERVEVVHDDSRDDDLTIEYFESEDGVCRTALASVGNQVHECRRHSCEEAWKFISQFRREK